MKNNSIVQGSVNYKLDFSIEITVDEILTWIATKYFCEKYDFNVKQFTEQDICDAIWHQIENKIPEPLYQPYVKFGRLNIPTLDIDKIDKLSIFFYEELKARSTNSR